MKSLVRTTVIGGDDGWEQAVRLGARRPSEMTLAGKSRVLGPEGLHQGELSR